MTSVRLRPPGPLEVGHSARVRQPGLLPATWTMDELVSSRVFAWTWRTPGARFAGLVFGRQTRRYLQRELEGLRETVR